MVRIIGIDPGLRHTGWGVIECDGPRLAYVACGALHSDAAASLAERLLHIHRQLLDVIARHAPDEAAIEETFVNRDGRATLKLGQARGAAMLAPASLGLSIAEYAPNLVKKSVVGAGHAEKQQVKHMVKMLLPRAELSTADAVDALAVAICHAHHRGRQSLTRALAEAGQRA